jgi:serine phosphatase RsbU (regulator of sigma subunit)
MGAALYMAKSSTLICTYAVRYETRPDLVLDAVNHRILLDPGDVLVLYTDGITEAQNAQEMFFGEERLLTVVQANLGHSAGNIQDSVIAKVHEFVNGASQFDDVTLMVVVRGLTESETR